MRLGRPQQAAGALLIGYFLVHLAALPSAPLTDDDDFYLPAGADYARWLGRVITFDRGAFTRAAVDEAFDANHEHPPVAKYVFGVSGALFSKILGPISGPRVGTVLFSTLCAAMLLVMAISQLGWHRGLWAGGLGVLLLLLLPRFFLHARVATLDVPVAGMYAAAAALALRAERSARAAWALGPVFGLAAATKLNAPFLVAPYLVFALLVRGGAGKAALPEASGRSIVLPTLPAGLLSMAVLGPITFFACWPWLWFDTVKRVGDYIAFHLGHYGIFFLYFGRLYEKDPFAPWHAPFVMAAITVPLAISVLALLGLLLGARAVLFRIYLGAAARGAEGRDLALSREGELVLWLFLHAVATIATVAFSGGAKYGGAKLFMPFFPFWCLLAGYGGLRLVEAARRAGTSWAVPATFAALGLAVVSSLGQQIRYRDVPLSQYNGLIGGLRGATVAGFERQYYDLAFRDLVALLNERAPKDTRIHFLPNNWEYERTFRWYRREGSLRPDLRVVPSEAAADWIVLTHERRFRRYRNDLLRARKWAVIDERRVDGVPIWTILDRR